jgi:hypothetical protein
LTQSAILPCTILHGSFPVNSSFSECRFNLLRVRFLWPALPPDVSPDLAGPPARGCAVARSFFWYLRARVCQRFSARRGRAQSQTFPPQSGYYLVSRRSTTDPTSGGRSRYCIHTCRARTHTATPRARHEAERHHDKRMNRNWSPVDSLSFTLACSM